MTKKWTIKLTFDIEATVEEIEEVKRYVQVWAKMRLNEYSYGEISNVKVKVEVE